MRRGEYACAVIVSNGKILLGLRAQHRKSYAGCWDVIGGQMNAGETALDALHRELGEEVGIAPVEPVFLTQLMDRSLDALTPPIYHFFRVSDWTGGVPHMRNSEHTELSWFTVDKLRKLPKLALPDYVPVFEQALVR